MTRNNCFRKDYTIIAFLIGLFSSSNLIYIFIVGSTPITPSEIFSLICFLCLFFSGQFRGIIKRYVSFDLKIFAFGIFISIIPILLFNIEYFYQYFVGLISILFVALTFLNVVALEKYRKFIFLGILIGIIISAIVSGIEYFYYYKEGLITKNGIASFDLANYFPASNSAKIYLSNPFAAKGLFKEQGHLMRYIAIFFLPICSTFFRKKRTFLNLVLLIFLLTLSVFTKSASFGVLLLFLLFYFTYCFKKNPRQMFPVFLIFITILLSVVVLSNFIGFFSKVLDLFISRFADLFSSDGGNSTRIIGMNFAFDIIGRYPLVGSGLNTSHKIFQANGFYGYGNVYGSYSAFLSLAIEIGLFSLVLLYFMLRKSFILIFKAKSNECVCLGFSLLIYFSLFCITDFNLDTSNAILLGLVIVEFSKIKQNEHISNLYSHVAPRCKNDCCVS